ncbi:hypothetical protein CO112_04020 [Candidatus Dojkabacteria bacterium CG_4_9_14_3_um_filter_150_Dojkabacteria_WS6_41_13]|uniref:D-alanine--D-alanine ligase n=1 Tax=Candidatus Dojkabacteria bacterium CG_4_10_14_0_2_um_filter_Dojkabacteria_WS6_41_15 TaxID=2014249 RepID=A0A2M7W385_9BACT|nr:MAG: hypothetical protein COX64_00190 [Candidatus Dojkabacteria bacterium CG_4_10_14_0_2_um_filter_Dojkabacteria_WS6_41_15]PJB22477.1 MAG: hypothetical protein CO112_04020 [Candidatus Dojkabacteria bacterium CG_4_9_14_3_um_filter_150_Dojkabacteria_WS6_41_13]
MASTEKKTILVMFGGISPEHEVSVISGTLVIENIDRSAYVPLAVYLSKKGEILFLGDIKGRKELLSHRRVPASFGRDKNGGYVQLGGLMGKKIYPSAAFLAFHGGTGEGGAMQGLLETVGIPYSSSSSEGAVITMNKQLTKEVVEKEGIATVPGLHLLTSELRSTIEAESDRVIKHLALPVIVKPVHLGSSIGINVAHSEVELQKYLAEAAQVDSEIVVEKYIQKFVEYNCAVRQIHGQLETSAIEKPISKDEILSFADKYERGAKKTGTEGMASLDRELPAKISDQLRDTIQGMAKKAFVACRCKGMVRIDFMATESGELYLTEVNPIPGSLAFFLWEAKGITFREQITDLIEQSVKDAQVTKGHEIDYTTNILEKFGKS